MKLPAILLAAFLIVIAPPARADDTIGESLDWLITSRPSIAVEVVTSTAPVPSKPGVNAQLTIQTALKTPIKGQPPQQTSFVRRWQAKAVPGEDDTARPADGTEYLLFFDDRGTVTNAINLSFPSRKVGFGADSNDVALANDFSIIKSGDLVMEAVHQRVAWLQAHWPAQPAAAGAAASPATPNGAVQIKVPMTSPAWDVLYTGAGQCLLEIPADENAANGGLQDGEHKITFAAPVMEHDCNALPNAAFSIRSAVAGTPHTLTISCSVNKDTSYNAAMAMTLTYAMHGALRDGDYGFEWGSNPDDPDSTEGYFTKHEHACEEMAQAMKFRLPRQTPILAATPDGKPMYASWTADCITSDVWKFVLAFELSIRSTPEDAVMATSKPLASVSSAVAAQGGVSDIILLPGPPRDPMLHKVQTGP